MAAHGPGANFLAPPRPDAQGTWRRSSDHRPGGASDPALIDISLLEQPPICLVSLARGLQSDVLRPGSSETLAVAASTCATMLMPSASDGIARRPSPIPESGFPALGLWRTGTKTPTGPSCTPKAPRRSTWTSGGISAFLNRLDKVYWVSNHIRPNRLMAVFCWAPQTRFHEGFRVGSPPPMTMGWRNRNTVHSCPVMLWGGRARQGSLVASSYYVHLHRTVPGDTTMQSTHRAVLARRHIPADTFLRVVTFTGTGVGHIWRRKLVGKMHMAMIICVLASMSVGQSIAPPASWRDMRLIPVGADNVPAARPDHCDRVLGEAHPGRWAPLLLVDLPARRQGHGESTRNTNALASSPNSCSPLGRAHDHG